MNFVKLGSKDININKICLGTIIGATTIEQLASNIDAYELKLSPEIISAINEIHK